MLNKAMIIGRIGQDPEVRYSQAGMAILNLSVATDESYTDRDGNRQERTEWHRVVTYDRVAENCGTYLRKGSLVFVEGSLQTRKWQDKQGQDRYTTEIRAQRVKFLDRKGDNAAAQGAGGQQDNFRRSPQPANRGGQGRPGPRQSEPDDFGPGVSDMDDVPFG